MTDMQPRILVFVEDPGAANYITTVLSSLKETNALVFTLAAGVAIEKLRQDGYNVFLVDDNDLADSLLMQFNPSLIVVGTSENTKTLGLRLIEAAHKSGIASVGVVDGAANATSRFAGITGNPRAFAPDWIFVPHEMIRQDYLSLGFNHESIIVAGHPHYDKVQIARIELERRGREAVRAEIFPTANDRRVVTFVAEVSTGLDPSQYLKDSSYTLHGRGSSNRRTEIVFEELIDALAQLPERPYCVLRLHPKNKNVEFSSYLADIQQFSQHESAWDVVFASDLVVGMSSHLMLESVILRRPTISILPKISEKNWLPTIAAGLTPCATSRDQLLILLAQWFQSSPEEWRSTADLERIFRFGATERVTQLLITAARVGKGLPVSVNHGSE